MLQYLKTSPGSGLLFKRDEKLKWNCILMLIMQVLS